jgi:hypothetical protein
LAVEWALKPTEGVDDINLFSQFAGPFTVRKLPGRMGRFTIEGVNRHLFNARFQIPLRAFLVTEGNGSLKKNIDGDNAGNTFRPIVSRVLIRLPPLGLLSGSPGDAVVFFGG